MLVTQQPLVRLVLQPLLRLVLQPLLRLVLQPLLRLVLQPLSGAAGVAAGCFLATCDAARAAAGIAACVPACVAACVADVAVASTPSALAAEQGHVRTPSYIVHYTITKL